MHLFLGILIGILVLTFVVTIHEFGHFIAAKRSGVKVNEFGIGFPPKAKAWLHIPAKKAKHYCKIFQFNEKTTTKILKRATKKNQKDFIWIPFPKSQWYKKTDGGIEPNPQEYLIFSLNFLPIGGFCAMDGESSIDPRPKTFGHTSFWNKTKILFAGVTMNWLLAIITFTILAWTGLPKLLPNQFTIPSDTRTSFSPVEVIDVVKDSPAEKAGIKSGDLILGIKSNTEVIQIDSPEKVIDFNKNTPSEKVTYLISHEKCPQPCNIETLATKEIEISLNPQDSKYRLGTTMGQSSNTFRYSTWSAPIVGIALTAQLTGETYRGIGTLFSNIISGISAQFNSDHATREAGKTKIQSAGDAVSGPVGIISVIFPAVANTGLTNILCLMAIISISLACMNILPIPALDGGRWLLTGIFKILKKPLAPETEGRIISRAFMLLLALAGFITILDVFKLLR